MHLPLCIVLSKKNHGPYEHPWLRTNNLSATPSPPPPPQPALVDIAVSGTHALESAILSSGLQGAHHHVAALSSSLVVVNVTCINSHITSNNFFPLVLTM